MSSQVMSPSPLSWDESYFRDLLPAPADVLVWPTRPTGRASTATAAVLTVGALGGIAVVAQAMVTGSIPLPVALGPAFSVVPPPATGSSNTPEVNADTSAASVSETAPGGNRGSVRDSALSGLAAVDGPAAYHQWQPPRLTHERGAISPDVGHHSMPKPERSAPLMHRDPWPVHSPGVGSGWARAPITGASTSEGPAGGRHRAEQAAGADGTPAAGSGHQNPGGHVIGDRGWGTGGGGHEDSDRTSMSNTDGAHTDDGARADGGARAIGEAHTDGGPRGGAHRMASAGRRG